MPIIHMPIIRMPIVRMSIVRMSIVRMSIVRMPIVRMPIVLAPFHHHKNLVILLFTKWVKVNAPKQNNWVTMVAIKFLDFQNL